MVWGTCKILWRMIIKGISQGRENQTYKLESIVVESQPLKLFLALILLLK